MPIHSTILYPITFEGENVHLPFTLVCGFEPFVRGHAFVATASIDPAISLYPVLEWETILCELNRVPTSHAHSRRLHRILLRYKTCLNLDADGQLQIPRALKRYAGIQKRAVALVFENKIEIWNPEELKGYMRAFRGTQRRELLGILRDTFGSETSTVMDALYPSAVVVSSSNQ